MYQIFKASEIDSNKSGWVCDLSGPDSVNPDAYFYFSSKASAKKFANLIESGLSVQEAKWRQEAAAALGHGRSPAKAAASQINGRKGGRPRKQQ